MIPQPSFNILLTTAQCKVIADLLPTFANRLKLDEKNSRTISFRPQNSNQSEMRPKQNVPILRTA